MPKFINCSIFPKIRFLVATILIASVAMMLPAQAHHPKNLVIGGTGTALGGMKLLAKAFAESHPDIHVMVLPSLGSGGGIKAVTAGKIDISLSARPLKKKEMGKSITIREYARTPFVFGTRHDTKASGVTTEQLAPIYNNNVNWPDGNRLRLIMRPAGESDIKLLSKISDEVKAAVMIAIEREELFVAMNDQDNAEALETTPGSFGLTTLAQVMSEERKIKLLTFNGKEGTVEGLQKGTYPFFKQLFYVTQQDPTPKVKAFIDFVRSPEGQKILSEKGHLIVDTDG